MEVHQLHRIALFLHPKLKSLKLLQDDSLKVSSKEFSKKQAQNVIRRNIVGATRQGVALVPTFRQKKNVWPPIIPLFFAKADFIRMDKNRRLMAEQQILSVECAGRSKVHAFSSGHQLLHGSEWLSKSSDFAQSAYDAPEIFTRLVVEKEKW